MTIRMVLNPTPLRVLLIGILMCVESILGGLLIILQSGRLPNEVELTTLLTVAVLTGVTFFMAFLRTGELNDK